MATLTGNKIKDSYLGLLKSISNGAISSSFVQISDGGGNALPLYLSTSSIKFYNAYTFPSADGTISGQVLSTDANGTLSWVTSSDNQTLEEVLTQGNTTTIAISSSANITTTAQFEGDINGALLQKVIAAEALSKGDVVYISGGTGDNPEVSKAKADISTTMPSLGIMKEPLSLNAEGECITSGELTGLGTLLGSFSTGDDLYVSSSTAGALQNTAPTGEANLIQKIGKVIRGGNGGALTVLGAFRTNEVPNLNSAKIFLGNASNQAVSTAISGDATISDTGVIALATVPVTKGGTGATTLTGILLGNGTSAISGITSANDGYVLTADGVGGYAFEVASGDVSVSGTPTANQIAIWTDGSTIKGMSALEIDVNDKITLDQDASSYNIGGGNIANVTGNYNTGFGLENLNVLTSGYHNTALGYRALKSVTTAVSNVAIGYQSLEFLATTTDHDNNTAVGLSSGRRNNGGNNTFIGFQSGQGSITASNNTGGSNTALGYLSLSKLTSGNSNTGVGTLALEDNTTGLLNTCLGHSSGKDITTGSKNVILGSFTGNSGGTDIRTSNNNIIISDGDGNNRIQVDSGGDTTFSGSVTADQGIFNSTANTYLGGSLILRDLNGANPKYLTSVVGNLAFSANGTNDHLLISSGGAIGQAVIPISDPYVAGAEQWMTYQIGKGGIIGAYKNNNESMFGFNTYVSAPSGLDKAVISGINGTAIRCYADQITFNHLTSSGTSQTQSTKLTISSGGNVGIGTTQSLSKLNVNNPSSGAITRGLGLYNVFNGVAGTGVSLDFYVNVGVNDRCARIISTQSTAGNYADLQFQTSNNAAPATRLTITSGGLIKVNGATSTSQFNILSSIANSILELKSTSTNPFGIYVKYTQAMNADSNFFFRGDGSTGQRVIIQSNGDLENANNSYGAISDIKLKENIIDATPKLNDLLKVKIRNYNLIENDKKQIGVIAQELEEIFPSMVSESPNIENREITDEEGNVTTEKVDLGTTTKSVKYSVFTPMLIKAIQEQQTIIEDLKARIETLEG